MSATFDVAEDKAEDVLYAVMTVLGSVLPYMADNVMIVQEEA